MADIFFIPHDTGVWIPAKRKKTNTYASINPISKEEGEQIVLNEQSWNKLKSNPCLSHLPAWANAKQEIHPAIDSLLGIDNLSELQSSNEGSILHSLRIRYDNKQIYTNVGNLVLSANPFEKIPNLYSDETKQKYFNAKGQHILTPHIYQVASLAIHRLMDDGKNQGIIISGESGAGKTEVTKQLLEFLTNTSSENSADNNIKNCILKANPIMESFGNAVTAKNQNSSRFGKLLQININNRGKIISGSVIPYLFETSRVCHHNVTDRNFHVFYRMLKKKLLNIADKPINYKILQKEDVVSEWITNLSIDDCEAFDELLASFKEFNLTSREQDSIFNIIAGLIHLGNVEFQASSDGFSEGSTFTAESVSILKKVSEYFEIDSNILKNALLSRKIIVNKESTIIPLKPQESLDSRNSLCQLIYSSLFNWLIARINEYLSNDDKIYSSILILDMPGFEKFEINSFEQFLINYANEKLHQQFLSNSLLEEYNDYKNEGLRDINLSIPNNEVILSVIESKTGIIGLLNEECAIPKGSDGGFTSKVLKLSTQYSWVQKSKTSLTLNFMYVHYAATIDYSTESWLQKNSFLFTKEAVDMLGCTNNNIIKDMIQKVSIPGKKMYVSSTFAIDLDKLVTKLNQSTSYYIRCIKPNVLCIPAKFDSLEVCRQLRYLGIIDAINLRKIGYSLRVIHNEFCNRYGIIVSGSFSNDVEKCKAIINKIIESHKIPSTDFYVGKTKVLIKEKAKVVLDDAREKFFSDLKNPLQPFLIAYEKALKEQNGMFLYPNFILGNDVNTPEALSQKKKDLESILNDIKSKFPSNECNFIWYIEASSILNSMEKEISIISDCKQLLSQVIPEACDISLVDKVVKMKEVIRKENIHHQLCKQLTDICDDMLEEMDLLEQLKSSDTDTNSLLSDLSSQNKIIFLGDLSKKLNQYKGSEKSGGDVNPKAPFSVARVNFKKLTAAFGSKKIDAKSAKEIQQNVSENKSIPAPVNILDDAMASILALQHHSDDTQLMNSSIKRNLAQVICKKNAVVKVVDQTTYTPRVKIAQVRKPPSSYGSYE